MANIGRAKRANRVNSQSIEPLESRVLLSTIVVNTTIDGIFPPSTGLVSLRNAIATANSSPTATEIDFDATVFATRQRISLNGNGLVLSASQTVSLVGPVAGLTINGNGQGTTIQVVTSPHLEGHLEV
ncbi:MAG TPA: hypothetical protein VN541_12085 [Tepidisphaeraceae bacterium]|nr:hypothetical protein [Tepidisphaeraceae bacterium]